MIHHVKTSSGISKGIICHSSHNNDISVLNDGDKTIRSGNIGGVGQGGGASPIGWLMLLITLMNAFKTFSDGAKLIDPEGLFGGIHPLC